MSTQAKEIEVTFKNKPTDNVANAAKKAKKKAQKKLQKIKHQKGKDENARSTLETKANSEQKRLIEELKAKQEFEAQYYKGVIQNYRLLQDPKQIELFCLAAKLNKPTILKDMWKLAGQNLRGNPKDDKGFSALEYAVKAGHLEIIKLLCELDTSIDLKNELQKSNLKEKTNPRSLI